MYARWTVRRRPLQTRALTQGGRCSGLVGAPDNAGREAATSLVPGGSGVAAGQRHGPVA